LRLRAWATLFRVRIDGHDAPPQARGFLDTFFLQPPEGFVKRVG